MIDFSQVLAYFPEGHSGPHGFEQNIFDGGPAALAAKIGEYKPERWAGCYVELGRDAFGKFSCVTWHNEYWQRRFARDMASTLARFPRGKRIAYLGISGADLCWPFKHAVQIWYDTMAMLYKAGFDSVGIDASATNLDQLGTYSEAARAAGLGVLIEGAPAYFPPSHNTGYISTTEEYRKGKEDEYTPARARERGKAAIIVDNGHPHDMDIPDAHWEVTSPMRSQMLEHFVATVRGAGGWPALTPYEFKSQLDAAPPIEPDGEKGGM